MILRRHQAVLLVAHGTVTDLQELPEFVARIRRGRPAGEGVIRHLRARYEAIGTSPLLEITRAQAEALSTTLQMEVLWGMRFSDPTLSQVLLQAVAGGVERLCVLPLAPFNAEAYCDAVVAAAHGVRRHAGSNPELVRVDDWGAEPAFIAAITAHIQAELGNDSGGASLVLTAHSVPRAIGPPSERYRLRVGECAAAIAARLRRPVRLCFQSQGVDGGDWVGPDLQSELTQLRAQGVTAVAVAPLGFVAEHLETLYDLDIEAAGWAAALGMSWRRLPAVGTNPALIRCLAKIARRALAS